MNCCADCIGDSGLEQAFPSLGVHQGDCGYCGSTSIEVLAPSKLIDLFSPLLRIYEPDADGRYLVDLLRDDWGMFLNDGMNSFKAAALLNDIFDDGELSRSKFSPSPMYATDSLERWENLRHELMYGNRYFPKVELKEQRLAELLELLQVPESLVPKDWYRARLESEGRPLTISEMGAPPREITSHGRANPAGIPYLYLCSEKTNSVAEIRPHTGEQVCIATFSISEKLKLIDLRNPRDRISPIDFGDEDKIGFLRSDVGFLSRLGDELTRPVKPTAAAIDYVPSQYLCEFIKKCGYDGVIYRSSVGEGINLALFDMTQAIGEDVTHHSIGKVNVVLG